ncbi:MAG: MucR family transcriptional regulator [Rhodospirillales bacterium]|nr:MucR family transcriptional regulator [Rhodospirillales bacterium]
MTEKNPNTVPRQDVLRMAADITAAYVGQNKVDTSQVPNLITTIFKTMDGLSSGVPEALERGKNPAVAVRRSVMPDFIVCLEDGRKMKMLKRHLRTAYNLSPDEYRSRWGLPPDYPMVAPSYAKRRSDFAKKTGLGRKDG